MDALDEAAVDAHLRAVVDEAACIDVSFNAIGIPNTKLLGAPLLELDVDRFCEPISCRTSRGPRKQARIRRSSKRR